MLLQNVKLSSIYSYLEEFRKRKESGLEIKTTSSLYDKDKGDALYFRQDNFQTTLNFSGDIILKDIKYEGYLEYTYYKKLGELFISHIPYVQYGDVKIPLLTSDLVKLIIDSLYKYIDASELTIITKDNTALIVIDEDAVTLLPSLGETKNYTLLKSLVIKIDKEIKKIAMDVKRYKEKKKREESSREIAIAKKRRVYGLDPEAFDSYQIFLNELSVKLSGIYEKKVQNISRHINSSIEAYHKIFQTLLSDEEKQIFNELVNAYEDLFRKVIEFLDLGEKSLTFYDFVDYSNKQGNKNWNLSDDYSFISEFIAKNCVNLTEEQKEKIDNELNYFVYDNLKGIKEAIRKLDKYTYDNSEKSALLLRTYYEIERGNNDCRTNSNIMIFLYNVQREVDLYKGNFRESVNEEFSYQKQNLWIEGECFSVIMINYLEDRDINPEFYHPIFRGKIDERRYDINFKLIKKAASILFQIDALGIQYNYYKSLVNNPLKALNRFSTDSNLWGNIMQIPYFIRKDVDPFDQKEKFNLLMIKPGIATVDFNNIKYFSADYGKRFGRKCTEKIKVYMSDKKEDDCDRLMICIPSSIEIQSLQKILSYAYKFGGKLNFVCESSEIAILLKSLIIDKECESFCEEVYTYNPKDIFINIDPTYYDTFMSETPGNKNFWHKYDYTSQYRFKRKHPLSFSQEILISISLILENGKTQVNADEIKKLLLGDYFAYEPSEHMEYQILLDKLSTYVFSKENWENYDYDLEKRLKHSINKR